MTPSKKQYWHIEPDRGLLNDPNGLSWFYGLYYAFFQGNRFEKTIPTKSGDTAPHPI